MDSLVYRRLESRDHVLFFGGGLVFHNSQAHCSAVGNKREAISSFGSLSLFTVLPLKAGTFVMGVIMKADETHKYAE